MYIVGTSGHIDHGKTSLIMALTGTDCDRLPEEKERAMTIDIGFASMEYPKFGTVSIIDVPGHERFIRNMVVGAWGIDLALLVVAVDDGWMPQTEDHFRVLQLLGVERIIAVLNKVDLADEEMIEFVEEEVKEKLSGTPYEGADICGVSSRTGQGIPELRETIVANLRKLGRAADAKKPYLFVDRIFGSKGYGTVVTGTLKNGFFHEDENVTILPGSTAARIKRIESHFHELNEGNPSQRTALNLSGVSTDLLRRGSIICTHNFFTESDDIIAGIRLLDIKKEIKNNLGIEVLIGTSAIKGKLIHVEEDTSGKKTFIARIRLDSAWHFYAGEPFILTSPGGYRIIGGGTILLPDYNSSQDRRAVRRHIAGLQAYTEEDIITFIVLVKNIISRHDLFRMFPQSTASLDRVITGLSDAGHITVTGDYLLSPEFRGKAITAMDSAIHENVGLNLKELSDHARIDTVTARLLIPAVMEKSSIVEKDGRFFAGNAITEDTLSDSKKNILREILKSGADGIELDRINDEKRKKEVRDLIKLEFLISLDGNIIYHRDIYSDLRDRVMELFDPAEKITVPEAKDATGLSRKYILPLLNRIESEGLLKRIGDFRIRA